MGKLEAGRNRRVTRCNFFSLKKTISQFQKLSAYLSDVSLSRQPNFSRHSTTMNQRGQIIVLSLLGVKPQDDIFCHRMNPISPKRLVFKVNIDRFMEAKSQRGFLPFCAHTNVEVLEIVHARASSADYVAILTRTR